MNYLTSLKVFKFKEYIPYMHIFHSIHFHTMLAYIQSQIKEIIAYTLSSFMNSCFTYTSHNQRFINTKNTLTMYVYQFISALCSVTYQTNLSICFNYMET